MLHGLKRALLACIGALLLAQPAAAQPSAADALITDYYQSILGRDPDAPGLAFWRNEAELVQTLGGDVTETWRALAISFFESPEYRAANPGDVEYLEDLYAAFFKRVPDAPGLAYWRGQLQAGVSREAVLLWFLFSAEFGNYMHGLFGDTQSRAEAQMVVDFYRGFLNRMPDESGFKFWVGRFRAAQCTSRQAVLDEVDAMTRQFLASGEYAGRARTSGGQVTDYYNAFLRRGPELTGFFYWMGRVEGGNREQIRREFMGSAEFQARVDAVVALGCPTLAAASRLTPVVVDQSVSPFVAVLELKGLHADRVTGVRFTVQPKAGAASRPVNANYTGAYLVRAGFGPTARYGYRVPLFGLYAAYANAIALQATFADGSTSTVQAAVQTVAFQDPTGVYANPTILKPRAPGSALEFDYFYIKGLLTSPIVMDTDGEVRWWVPGAGSVSILFERNGFTVGLGGMGMRRIGLDGFWSDIAISSSYTEIHHNIDPGRTGILVEVDGVRPDGTPDIENDLIEVAPDGRLIQQWRFDEIISSHMRSRGDDPDAFVRHGVDWFHMNAAAYDAHDDTIIASSRENFIIKVRYTTGEILWILGDPTKYWYTFPSLREKAITLVPAGAYPIGQHAVSVLPSGEIMVFSNGAASLQQPAGAPAGESRAYSEVLVYAVNPGTMTGRVTRAFDYDRTIPSLFCSSAYAAGASMLVNYSRASSGSRVRLVGVGGDNRVVFDHELVNPGGCNASFNAVPLPFEAMYFP